MANRIEPKAIGLADTQRDALIREVEVLKAKQAAAKSGGANLRADDSAKINQLTSELATAKNTIAHMEGRLRVQDALINRLQREAIDNCSVAADARATLAFAESLANLLHRFIGRAP